MAKLEGIKACVFDAYGTLFDVHTPVRKLAAEIGPKADALTRLWRQKQLEYTWLRSLMGVHADYWKVTGDALTYALASEEIDEPGLKEELMVLYLKLDPYPDALPALTALKSRGMRLAILSNGSPSMLDSTVRHAGLDKHFEHVLSVEDVGIYKPSRRVYRLAMQKLALHDAPAICFLSANPWDAQGAAQFGFQSVRIDRFGLKDDVIPGKPAALIPSLEALPGLV
ncbi:MAG: haloacid dehalogenase type II [Hyphomicrobiales bacterium]